MYFFRVLSSLTFVSTNTLQSPTIRLKYDHHRLRLLQTTSTIETQTHQKNDYSVLSCLFGSNETLHNFFENDFGKRVIHKRRSPQHDLPSPLFLLQNGNAFDIKYVYENSQFINLRKRGSIDFLNKNTMSYEDFTDYIHNQGGSAVVSIGDKNDGDLFTLRRQIELSLGDFIEEYSERNRNVSMNLYHSGPQAVALNRHYDKYDVLVLQIEGEKEWEIASECDNQTYSNITMKVGDLLYIPHGVYHAATTVQGCNSTTSTHVTIGLEF